MDAYQCIGLILDTVPDFVVFAGAVTAASILILHFFSFSFIFILLAVSILILAWSTRREGFSRKNIRRPMVCACLRNVTNGFSLPIKRHSCHWFTLLASYERLEPK